MRRRPRTRRTFPPSVRPGRAQLELRTARKEFRGRRSPVKALHRRARLKRRSRLKRGRFPPKSFNCSPCGPVARCLARKLPGPKAAGPESCRARKPPGPKAAQLV